MCVALNKLYVRHMQDAIWTCAQAHLNTHMFTLACSPHTYVSQHFTSHARQFIMYLKPEGLGENVTALFFPPFLTCSLCSLSSPHPSSLSLSLLLYRLPFSIHHTISHTFWLSQQRHIHSQWTQQRGNSSWPTWWSDCSRGRRVCHSHT